MSIGWPAAIVLMAVIFGAVTLLATQMAAKAGVAGEEAKGKYGEQYRMLADDYEKLANETRDIQAAIRADVAGLAQEIRGAQASIGADVNRLANSVESIETMMRDVG